MDYLPFLLLPRDRIMYIFLLTGLIPLNGIPYFISVTVSGPCLADTVISIEGQDGGSSDPNMSTSFLYKICKNYPLTHAHLLISYHWILVRVDIPSIKRMFLFFIKD